MNEQAADKVRSIIQQAAVERGAAVLVRLMDGPEEWAKLERLELTESQAKALVMLTQTNPGVLDDTWLQTQRFLVEQFVTHLFEDFELWCISADRKDLLVTGKELLNSALPPGDQV